MMPVARISAALFFFFAASLLAIPHSALSQQPSDTNQPSGIGEDQLRSFARAYVGVEKVRESYEPQLMKNQDPQRSREIEKEAISKIDEVIAQEGFTPESYSRLVQTANADNELRKKILDLINEEKNKSS
jgi:Domain of unknown function (DUF4168)